MWEQARFWNLQCLNTILISNSQSYVGAYIKLQHFYWNCLKIALSSQICFLYTLHVTPACSREKLSLLLLDFEVKTWQWGSELDSKSLWIFKRIWILCCRNMIQPSLLFHNLTSMRLCLEGIYWSTELLLHFIIIEKYITLGKSAGMSIRKY